MAVRTEDGTVTYRAMNGHLMEYWEDPDNPGKPARDYAWAAWCAEGCGACAEGDTRPDW
jgi:hypothetical protein